MKKNKLITTLILSSALALSASVVSFAQGTGSWKNDGSGWWWQNHDGTYPTNGWQWIDGNNDGIAECYYFTPSGYILTGTTTPDNYTVDENGAWTINGVLQQQAVQVQETAQENNVSLDEWKDNVRTAWKTASFAEYATLKETYEYPTMLNYTFTVPQTSGLTTEIVNELCQEIHDNNNMIYRPVGFYGYYWQWRAHDDVITIHVLDVMMGFFPDEEMLRSKGFTFD